MKKMIFSLLLILIPFIVCAQPEPGKVKKEGDQTGDNKQFKSESMYGWNKRISFFVGAGASFIKDDVYESPVIDRSGNYVIIEKAGHLRSNISAGIVFTPWVYNVKREIDYMENGVEKKKTIISYEPKHFSIALFINPVSFTPQSSSLSSSVDLGFGLGWRSDNFAIFATWEFFSIKQPREYFIEAYKSNDKQYIVGGEIQTAIDVNDNSIFKDQMMTSFGIKMAYSFDIANAYAKQE